ncbi:FAD binding domain-containing protein [candidate division KSB1 bacterium]|nr:FAD binding domain-containing protein [candidate division KSB1 bacterium]
MPIHFWLNNHEVTTKEPAGRLVLDYLRQKERLVGTKEGCKEGDCGACMVLIGELSGNQVEYKPVTSCLMPVGELHGKHLVTIEGLNLEKLTPVQQAIVDEGGSQCGFCTPGIVVSLTGYLMQPWCELNAEGIKYALGGNLCRCTGYASLMRAGSRLLKQFGNGAAGNGKKAQNPIKTLIKQKALPDYFQTIPERLKKIPSFEQKNSRTKPETFVAGGTDIYVQRGDELPDSQVDVLNLRPEMKEIRVKNGKFYVGALTTFEEFAVHPEIKKVLPDMPKYNLLNASWQIRNRATLGGNIVNASPIGDMTALLLALECDLVLKNGKKQRTVPMKSFFKGYKVLEKSPSEILTEIIFPVPDKKTKVHFEKVSKRKTLDIASVNSAIKVRVEKGTIQAIEMSMGGVAPIPLFMNKTCEYLKDKPVNRQTILDVLYIAMSEISPISDIRGSAEYKRLLVRQFIIAHFTKLYPEFVTVREFYETH